MTEIQVGSWREEANAASVQLAISKLKTNPELAIDQLTSLAESGSVKSMLYLADALARGSVVKIDFRRARFWYKKIGERGIIFSDHMAGSMSVKLQELEQARVDFWRCASAGFLPSIYRKGYMLSVGYGGNKDLAEARDFWKTAANRG